ncbi:MAG: D-alanyl-D-alanine carboxypeptidase [Limnochordaceae bacterium]|nr:D-alanyl-D-alanine carboxypeptidase [Limnochordaceae bacterium]
MVLQQVRRSGLAVLLSLVLVLTSILESGVGLAQTPSPGTTSPPSPSPRTPGFDVAVPSAILVDVKSGQTLFEKNADEPLPLASISKIMVMLLAMEAVAEGRAKLSDTVTISSRAESMGGSQMYLAAGSQFTLQELMEMVAVASANDATVAITEYLAGSEGAFVDAMNRRAKELGLTKTRFYDASGLPLPGVGENRGSSRDVAKMSLELVKKHPQVLEWTSIWTKTIRPELPTMVNTNKLINHYPGANGLKTGYTEQAGYCVAATATRGDRTLLAVIFRAASDDQRVQEASRLLDYGFDAFNEVLAVPSGTQVGTAPVKGGRIPGVQAIVDKDVRVLLPRIVSVSGVDQKFTPKEDLQAPIKKGQTVGELVLRYDSTELDKVPAVAAADVPRAGLLTRLILWLRHLVTAVWGAVTGRGR